MLKTILNDSTHTTAIKTPAIGAVPTDHATRQPKTLQPSKLRSGAGRKEPFHAQAATLTGELRNAGLDTSWPGNHLLSNLSCGDLAMLSPLQRIEVHEGDDIHRAGDILQDVIFPLSCVISIIIGMRNGTTVEAAMIGPEGILGTSALAGRGSILNNAVVRTSGIAYRVPRKRFLIALSHSTELQENVARCEAVLLAEAQQTTACNASHSAHARVSRWLLEARDRCGRDVVPLKQHSLAQMLGLRRTTVTLVESRLQRTGFVRCGRGAVQILDAQKLRGEACECYERMLRLREDLLPGPAKAGPPALEGACSGTPSE